ncbi:vWA domain-containing protein [Noviherbaspirillum denitrificans]|uniref:ABC transporter ATP-binding protein n=1 Tax=Noviherbaspirillum denitrificans TaxID=1968433 RepID=A0A254T9J0_9BURK|nr:VWA domain-containing protein [Noviherbaspirillum denitrificans]OWW18827.1 ABC transporter ATP-binding protein [Noviherbaspirillum denitrificans]
MTFIWPELLWLLLVLPALVLVYWLMLRRRKKVAIQYAGLATVRAAMGGSQFRRHVPPLLFLLAIALMLLAAARPAAVLTLPSEHKTMILAIDVSGSMRATDVAPSRFAAALTAVRTFVEQQPRNTRVGIVSFAGAASLVQPPTTNKDDLLEALGRMQLQRGTAVGSGILVSLKAIFPDVRFNLNTSDPRDVDQRGSAGARALGSDMGKEPPDDFKPVPPGSYGSAAIILLTDGQTTTGPDPVEASRMAAERGVRVFTIGIGTAAGEVLTGDGWAMHVRLDEAPLKEIAELTKAQYFYAGTANDLAKVYKTLSSRLTLERRESEVSALFAAGAALLAILSAALSMLWFNRIL